MSSVPLLQMMESFGSVSLAKLGATISSACVAIDSFPGTLGAGSAARARGSDAAPRLGQSGAVRHLLGRLLREQPVEILGRDPDELRHAAQRRSLALLGVVRAEEVDDLPMLVRERAELD